MNREFLPEIIFCETDAAKVEAAIITQYEAITSKSLYPGDPVRLFLEGVAFLIAQQNSLIDFTGKQNLLHYAWGDYLDHLGNYLHTLRLSAQAASTILEFTLSEARPEDVHIPGGTRIKTMSGEMEFAIIAELTIAAGDISGRVVGTCTEAGRAGNDFLPGQITRLVDPVAYVATVQNVTTSTGGADLENDEGLRLRTSLAVEAYGSAGSLDAYRYHVKSVHQDIIDEAIWQAAPGEVYIAPLMRGGELPTDEVIKAIHDHVTADKIRPFTDLPTVVKPTIITAEINLKYYILVSYAAKSAAIIASVQSAVASYISWQRLVLGRDILPSKLIEFIQGIQGIQRVEVTTPGYKALDPWQVAHLTVGAITYGGLAHE